MGLIDGLVDYLRGTEKKTAADAKHRLQLILAHDRGLAGADDHERLLARTAGRVVGCESMDGRCTGRRGRSMAAERA